MVVIDVFHKHITVIYKNHLFSKACFLLFSFGLITVVLPFILAYRSKGEKISIYSKKGSKFVCFRVVVEKKFF